MFLNALYEDPHDFNIVVTRDRNDFKLIKQLDKELYGRKGYRPPISYIVIIAKKGKDCYGYAVAQPHSKIAYNRRCGVHPDYQDTDLSHRLISKLMDTCKSLGFKYTTARSSDDGKNEMFNSVFGEPIGHTKFKHATVSKFKKDLLSDDIPVEQRATERKASRAGPMYKS